MILAPPPVLFAGVLFDLVTVRSERIKKKQQSYV